MQLLIGEPDHTTPGPVPRPHPEPESIVPSGDGLRRHRTGHIAARMDRVPATADD